MADEDLEPFEIAIADAAIDDLRRRLEATRWPALDDASWDDGAHPDWIGALVAHWLDDFDWRHQEARLNALPQFLTTIDGQQIHFAHERSERADAVPLLLMHGWPSTFVEFRHVVHDLAHPAEPSQPAFHVVVPSLPGFGFSGPTKERVWGGARIAAALAVLMARLGYDRYLPHGGDVGYSVAQILGRIDPDHVPAIHMNMGGLGLALAHRNDPDLQGDAERRAVEKADLYVREKGGYAVLQSTRPQTIAFALSDSPVGQLAWIAEKVREWSDPANPVADDDLLTNVALTWFTNTSGSSGRFYRAGFDLQAMIAGAWAGTRLEVPAGITAWPHEIVPLVRRWVEQDYDVRYWAEPPAGGHFAALETPELLVGTLRAFAAQVL